MGDVSLEWYDNLNSTTDYDIPGVVSFPKLYNHSSAVIYDKNIANIYVYGGKLEKSIEMIESNDRFLQY
jgi:hypothetical protein